MQINIQARGFDLTEGLRSHTLMRMQFALGWARHHLRKVTVHLSDENGPRGAEDKRCRVRVGRHVRTLALNLHLGLAGYERKRQLQRFLAPRDTHR